MAFDIHEFIFYDILKYSPSSTVVTGDIQNDVIFGLLIPTIFIAIVLHFSVRNVFGAGHAFIGNLAALTGLGVIVTLGWVPIIAGLGGFVFVALLAVLFVGAFYRRLVPEGAEMKLRGAAAKAGSMIDVGNPVIPPKVRRAYGVRLHSCENDYNSAVTAIQAYSGSGSGPKMLVGESKFEQTTEVERHTNMMNHAFEKGVQLIENFPKGNSRVQFIKEFTDSDPGDFRKKLLLFFNEQDKIERS